MPAVAIDARDAFAADLRGWGRYARELVAALRDVPGFRWRVLARGWPGPELLWEQAGLPVWLARARPAVVHAPNCFLPLVRPRGTAGVVTIHDLAFEDFPEDFAPRTGWKFRTFTPRAARSADRVICVSRWTADQVCARYGVDRERVRVVPNGPALAPGTLSPPAGPYLLGVGDLREKKNWGVLVEAWRTLRRDGLPHRLILAGADAGSGPALRAAAGSEPLELTGYVEDARLDALLRGADLLVHPSLHEGFGLVVVEAMARGVPVAVARAGALPETAGGAAELFDPRDARDVARAVRAALAGRDRLVAAGRARAAEFSWARTARETADVYRELV